MFTRLLENKINYLYSCIQFFVFKVVCTVYRVPIFGGRGEAIVSCSGMREGKQSIQWLLEVPISGRREGSGCVLPGNFSPYFAR